MKVVFHKISTTTKAGRAKKTRTPYKEMWANEIALSEQRKVEGLEIALDGSLVFEVRMCAEVRDIRRQLKHFEVEHDDDFYNLQAGDFTKKDHAFVWFKATKSE